MMPSGEPWGADAETVRSMWEAGRSDFDIATAVSRSRHAVKKFRQSMGWVSAPGVKPKGDALYAPPEPINDDDHVLAIMAHGGFERQALKAMLWREARRRGIAA
jgi:hypothetical protein